MINFGCRKLLGLVIVATLMLFKVAAPACAYDLHFDYTSFETGFGQSQFNVLNYPSINGNYMMTSTDNHRPEMVANGNELAEFYNWLTDRYSEQTVKNGAAAADVINTYTVNNSTNNGPRPTWLVLNEISSSLWTANPGAPSLSTYRTWLIDCVTRLTTHHGYNVVTLAPFQNPGQNNASWQALSGIANNYIGIECYLSGPEVWAGGADYDSRREWAEDQYQASKNSYIARGVPASKLFVTEHFANNALFTDNGTPILWGRNNMASASDWDQVIMIRQDAIYNVGFDGFLAYNWGGNGMGVTQAEQIQHEYYYRSRRVLPSQKPQWLSDAAINVNGTTIPLSWNQPLNWLGGVPNANGAEANFWRTLTTNRTVTLDGNKTIGKLTFDSQYSYTIAPGTGGSLIFSNTGSAATLISSQGSHLIGVNVQLANDLSATVAAGTVTISGPTSGAGALTKSGAGALVLNGANNYTGATTITAGALRVSNMLNTPGAAITVGTGGKLEATVGIQRTIVNNGFVAGPTAPGQQLRLAGHASGLGDYTGNVAFAGGFSPGDSATSVTLGNGTFESGNTLTMQIGGLAEGSQFDHLNATGGLTLGGTLMVLLIGGFTPQAGDAFNLFDATAVSGAFHTITLPALFGQVWDDSQLYSHGILSVLASADFNADGAVDGLDLAEWSDGFGALGGATHSQGDADGDGDVDGADFLSWQLQLGTTPTLLVIPEPASLLQFIVVLGSLWLRSPMYLRRTSVISWDRRHASMLAPGSQQ